MLCDAMLYNIILLNSMLYYAMSNHRNAPSLSSPYVYLLTLLIPPGSLPLSCTFIDLDVQLVRMLLAQLFLLSLLKTLITIMKSANLSLLLA